jgi:hypothetical protein
VLRDLFPAVVDGGRVPALELEEVVVWDAGHDSMQCDGLGGCFSEALTFSTLNKFSFTSLVRKPTLTLNAATGMITGTITEPAGKVRKIQAALCNSAGQSYLAGYVTGTKRNIACTVTVP